MRKLGSAKEIERKRKRNTLIISIFVLALLVVGTVGYGFTAGPGFTDTIEEPQNLPHGTVTNNGNNWLVSIQGQNIQFSNSPESTRNVSVNITNTLQDYRSQTVYLAIENTAIESEIGSILSRYSPTQPQRACYGPCEEDIPEKDCSTNMIVWKDSLENKVYQEEKCIFIEGDSITADAFLFKILGV